MELRHLRYFVAVAEELNFSRAAERLHIAQPPLSKQIRDLEAELGVVLFNRTKRRVELTDPGQVFLEKVHQSIQSIEQAVEAVQRASRGEIGRLSVGFNSSATYSVLPQILRGFRERYPQVELYLHELTTSQTRVSLSTPNRCGYSLSPNREFSPQGVISYQRDASCCDARISSTCGFVSDIDSSA